MDTDSQDCPRCGTECYRDSVDIEVGVIYGPWGCPACGWSSSPEYDHSSGGPCSAQAETSDSYVDQWGNVHKKSVMRDTMKRFGLKPDVIDDVFP